MFVGLRWGSPSQQENSRSAVLRLHMSEEILGISGDVDMQPVRDKSEEV